LPFLGLATEYLALEPPAQRLDRQVRTMLPELARQPEPPGKLANIEVLQALQVLLDWSESLLNPTR
jgi:hypothetical protein